MCYNNYEENKERKFMNIKKWVEKNSNILKNKRVVITGATGGLGREICSLFASLGADLTFACRNKTLSDKLANEIKISHPDVNIDFVNLDLSNLESVKNCIIQLKKYKGIDILINNAGVYNVPIETLDSGFNNIFQINFLYVYYLTKQLLPELEKRENSTCITLGSIAHNYSKLDEGDIDFSKRKKQSKIYGNSKRFLMFSFFELFKNSKVDLSIVHPGVTLTNMTGHYHRSINWLVKFLIKIFFPSAKAAAFNVLYGASHRTKYHEWIGPSNFNIWGKPKLSKLKTCSNLESEKIYKIAEKLYQNLK